MDYLNKMRDEGLTKDERDERVHMLDRLDRLRDAAILYHETKIAWGRNEEMLTAELDSAGRAFQLALANFKNAEAVQ